MILWWRQSTKDFYLEEGLIMEMILNQKNVDIPSGLGSVGVYTDNETGVEYFVYSSLGVTGVAICPRYNADGSLKINQEYLDALNGKHN